jgi:hypothetical protein
MGHCAVHTTKCLRVLTVLTSRFSWLCLSPSCDLTSSRFLVVADTTCGEHVGSAGSNVALQAPCLPLPLELPACLSRAVGCQCLQA